MEEWGPEENLDTATLSEEILPEESFGEVSLPEIIPEEAASEGIVFGAAEEILLEEGALESAEEKLTSAESSTDLVLAYADDDDEDDEDTDYDDYYERTPDPVSITITDAALACLLSWQDDKEASTWKNTDIHYEGLYLFRFSKKMEVKGALEVDEEEGDEDEDGVIEYYEYEFEAMDEDPVTIDVFRYSVNISSSIYGGTVTADKTKAEAGDTVTLTVIPQADDFELASLSVKRNSNQKEVPVTDGKFIMPPSDVTVNAIFKSRTRLANPLASTEGLAQKPLIGISGTTTNPSESFSMLFDGKTDTKWCVADSIPCYVEMDAKRAFIPKAYSLTTANDSDKEKGRNPLVWLLEGRNTSEEAWTTLSEVCGNSVLQDQNFTQYDFAIDTDKAYRYYRFTVSLTQGSNYLQLSELSLWGVKEEGSYHVKLPKDVSGGSVVLDTEKSSFKEGERVSFTMTPSKGYFLYGCTVTCSDDGTILFEGNEDNNYYATTEPISASFIMPNTDVIVDVLFHVNKHKITCHYDGVYVDEEDDYEYDPISALRLRSKPTKAGIDETITVTTSLQDQVVLESLTAIGIDDDTDKTFTIPLTQVKNGTYTFVMPNADVQLHASFYKTGDYAINPVADEDADLYIRDDDYVPRRSANAGEMITLRAKTKEEYDFKGFRVIGEDGTEIQGDFREKKSNDYEFRFVMPSQPVTVTTLFEPNFRRKSVLLSGQIGVNFYMDLSALDEETKKSCYMTFTVGNSPAEQRDNFDESEKNLTEKYYEFTCFVNSVQMADDIHAVYHYADKTVSMTYSVKAYIDYFKEHSSEYDSPTIALIHAIADYGCYAQQHLSLVNGWSIGADHKAMPAASTITSAMASDASSGTEPFASTKSVEGCDIEDAFFRLSLESATRMDVYLIPKNGAVITATIGDSTENAAVLLEDGRYRVSIEDIPAHQLGDLVTIHVTAGKTGEIKVSALSYVNAVIKQTTLPAGTTNEEIRALTAFYNYYKRTMEYRQVH